MNDSSLRIGVVRYANALPLEHDLPLFLPRATIVRGVPSSLAVQLQRGELDVAMISSIELMRHPEYSYIPGLGVCSDGPVRSVCLFSKMPPTQVQTVALDQSSLTSITLVRILYQYFWRHIPQYCSFVPPVENGLQIADAALSIGDPTLQFKDSDIQTHDMGETWRQYSQLPFVFAVWITRPGIDPHSLAKPFTEAAESALQKVDALAKLCAKESCLTQDFYQDYFTNCIHYHMNERDREGMRLFFEQAQTLD